MRLLTVFPRAKTSPDVEGQPPFRFPPLALPLSEEFSDEGMATPFSHVGTPFPPNGFGLLRALTWEPHLVTSVCLISRRQQGIISSIPLSIVIFQTGTVPSPFGKNNTDLALSFPQNVFPGVLDRFMKLVSCGFSYTRTTGLFSKGSSTPVKHF